MKEYRLTQLPTSRFIGMCTQTSLSANGVPPLWQAFRPRAKEVIGKTEGFYNLTRYAPGLVMADFTPVTHYEAWAVVKIENENTDIPEGMMALVVSGGTYAVFSYQGLAADFSAFAGQIFGKWLPEANLKVDNTRPHFEYLPPGYRPDDPEAREEVWVPVLTVE